MGGPTAHRAPSPCIPEAPSRRFVDPVYNVASAAGLPVPARPPSENRRADIRRRPGPGGFIPRPGGRRGTPTFIPHLSNGARPALGHSVVVVKPSDGFDIVDVESVNSGTVAPVPHSAASRIGVKPRPVRPRFPRKGVASLSVAQSSRSRSSLGGPVPVRRPAARQPLPATAPSASTSTEVLPYVVDGGTAGFVIAATPTLFSAGVADPPILAEDLDGSRPPTPDIHLSDLECDFPILGDCDDEDQELEISGGVTSVEPCKKPVAIVKPLRAVPHRLSGFDGDRGRDIVVVDLTSDEEESDVLSDSSLLSSLSGWEDSVNWNEVHRIVSHSDFIFDPDFALSLFEIL